jgi:hypothetical protein
VSAEVPGTALGVTVTVAVADAASAPLAGLSVYAAPLASAAVQLNVAVPLFCTVNVCGAAVVPQSTLPKLMLLVEMATFPEVPLPVSVSAAGSGAQRTSAVATLIFALAAPTTLGANDALAARDPPTLTALATRGVTPKVALSTESVTDAAAFPPFVTTKGLAADLEIGTSLNAMVDGLNARRAPFAVWCSGTRCGVSPRTSVVSVSVSA